uniref:Small integral membrane protein 14 n=1 Tax=Heterorhabditis bacteriophora TaxID=37862 RepID=A0A1I7X6H0_HETBA
MSDDSCAYLFSHATAMRRLLSLLRDTQDFCTDSECLTDSPDGSLGGSSSILLWSMLWGLIALAMFFLRPNSMRSNPQPLRKPGTGNGNVCLNIGNNEPPPPGIM